jgi:hypothetical protein
MIFTAINDGIIGELWIRKDVKGNRCDFRILAQQ